MQIIDYIKVFNKTPLLGLLGEFKTSEENNCEVFEVLKVNLKMKEVLNEVDVLGKDIVDIFGIKNREKIKLIYKQIKKEKEYSIEEYIPRLNKFYKLEILHICEKIYVVWLKPFFEFDKCISNALAKLNCLTWIKDKRGRYISTNINKKEFYNLNEENIIGKTDSEIFPKEVADAFVKGDLKLLTKEVDYISMLSFVNGKHYDVSSYPIYDDNEIVATIGFARDITGEDDCKIESETQKKMIELIGDNIPDHIFFKDSEGVFRYCNDAFAKSNGVSKDEIIGKNDFNLDSVRKFCALKYVKEDEKVYKSKEGIIVEAQETGDDGRKIYRETIKVPFVDSNGFVGGILGISRDISHRKEAEMEFERLRMEFFANLSHEFRTPLNLIFSSVQLLNMKLSKCDICNSCKFSNKEYGKYIDIINRNGFRLLKLVNNLIDITKLDGGTLEYNPVNYDIVKFIENIVDLSSDFANENGIEMIFDTSIEEKIIAFNLEQMERIILNLISNSIKFNKPDGKIEVSIDCNDEFVEIQVKDNGIGIPEDEFSEVFEKFNQVNNRMTKVSEGSGIGLSLVKSLVELHNGSISIESELNKYTKFIIKIPNVTTSNEYSEKEEYLLSKYAENIQIEFSDIYSNLNV
ncbi:PAS domain-containing sensor histidine kinase [Clostridium sp. CCUG 7971]|uniref:PAS domain-containing sensor histidine kinase n=1 Tax=Clostridium sp. CCUG 7971 TaxID=2811414 RepID=UPI001ABB1FED|nr:PAS domain-containing sensor histidine kinase [Clostridium sp. CCUG 7971]MBO3445653.1 PAS domain-containing sensor histidine kinase [Clostridium sp. CCUG 7971]